MTQAMNDGSSINPNAIFNTIEQLANTAMPREPCDYVGDDELLYCGRCHTRKQFKMPVNIAGECEKTLPIPCDCKKAQMAKEEAEREQKERTERIERMRGASMMDEALKMACFENAKETPDNRENLATCKAYAGQFNNMLAKNQGLLLMGDVGTGKTYMAACIANELILSGTPCIMTSFVRLITLTKPYEDDSDDGAIETLLRVPLLVIDDLGAQRDTAYATERVYDFINRRVLSGKPMVITTNITDPKQLTNAIEVSERRIYDRILQHCAPIMFAGKSWRLQEARERTAGLKKELGL